MLDSELTERTDKKAPPGQGVRKLRLSDIAPDCEITITKEKIYDLSVLSKKSMVLDIGCGHGRNREVV